MIKRIIIISVLTICLCFSTLVIYQRKAEAVVPILGYVALSLLVHLSVGVYMYLTNPSTGNNEKASITNINSSTGEIIFDFMDNDNDGSPDIIILSDNLKPFYPRSTSQVPSGMLGTQVETHAWSGVVIDQYIKAFYDNHAATDYISYWVGAGVVSSQGFDVDGIPGNSGADGSEADSPIMYYDVNEGSLGGVYTGIIDGNEIKIYDFIEDIPLLPTCFDGIQNQDETGVDCGGVCEINFGFVCPPEETCFDGIMNQDETGIDYGGVCGIGGEPSPAGPEPTNFVDANIDGIDDLSGYDSAGNVPIGSPGDADGSTYDTSLPGDISEVGETNWTGLITSYLSTNPLVLLATGSSINLSGEECTLTANLYGTDIVIDFCSMESMINLIGTFVLGLMAIRSVFIAMGI